MTGSLAVFAAQGFIPGIIDRAVVGGGAIFPTTGQAGVSFNGLTGDMSTSVNFVNTSRAPEWAGSQGTGSANPGAGFEIRCDVLSGLGPNNGDLINTWLTLSGTGREWSLERSAIGSSVGTWRVQIRPINGNVLAQADYSITTTISSP